MVVTDSCATGSMCGALWCAERQSAQVAQWHVALCHEWTGGIPPSIIHHRFVRTTTRCATDDTSQLGPRRISGFEFQA
jgi:hypothetical protein